MKYRSILVPYDQSDIAYRAFLSALDLARDAQGTSVTVLYVADEEAGFDIAARMASVNPEEALSSQKHIVEQAVKSAILDGEDGRAAMEEGCNLSTTVEEGRPQDVIPAFAKKHGCDLIVMGSRGLGAFSGMIGSVSKAVLHAVDVPVLVVK